MPRLLLMLIGILLLAPRAASACTCYSDLAGVVPVNPQPFCAQACNTDFAAVALGSDNCVFAEPDCPITSGTCVCSETPAVPFSCEDVCEDAGYNSEPPPAPPAPAAPAAPTTTPKKLITPTLSVEIPDLKFSDGVIDGGVISVNFLGEYVAAMYKYLLGISTTIAIVMVMINGLEWTISGGSIMGTDNKASASRAKTRIRNAVTGLVLLLGTYLILFTVNPNLVGLRSIRLTNIELIALDQATSGDEGVVTGSVSPGGTCDKIVETARSEGSCNITQSFASPTGRPPNCGNHHWFDGGANGDYKNIKNLDYAADWGTSILAPFDGTVTYKTSTGTSNRCGNTITLTGTGKAAGAKIFICHAKDFLDGTNTYTASRTVNQGDVLGHLGGNCCAGETPPADWSAAKNGWCKVSGTACTDPTKSESCSCQSAAQAGNTSGPHVHITWSASGGDLLACLDS